jgi:3-methyladenine DNA glycosylase AlkD
MSTEGLRRELEALADPVRAEKSLSFFNAVPGGYGEGDRFLGIRVPDQRKIAKRYARLLDVGHIEELLHSEYHEIRLTALHMLVYKYRRGSKEMRERIVDCYLRNLSCVDNWDLVDSSASKILGPHLYATEPDLLFELVESEDMWHQRIAVITTHHFIREGRYDETLMLAEALMSSPHDLIHKAVGWMLREIGNRNFDVEYNFLLPRYRYMPRTMLRYAIEKFDTSLRKSFLEGSL